MAFSASVHENFIEFPTGAAPSAAPGTLWAGSPALCPRVEANTDFHSGKALFTSVTRQELLQRTFPASAYLAAPSQIIQFNFIRTANNFGDNTQSNRGAGWFFYTGVMNTAFRITFGNASIGLGNTLYLQYFAGSTVMQLAFVSDNIFQLGVKYDCALRYTRATGTVELYANGSLVNSVSLVGMTGLDIIGMGIGRLGNISEASEYYTGDIYVYTDSPWLGPVEIRGGLPTADDTLQDWTFTGPTAWQSVNNLLAASPADYIESGTPGDISDFDCAVDNTSVFDIFSVCVSVYATRTDVLPVDIQPRLGQGVTFTNGANFTPPQATYERNEQVYLSNPNTVSAWVPADLSALLVGVEYV